MSITSVQSPTELDELPGALTVVGFFGAFSARATEAYPAFAAFAEAHPELPVFVVDVGQVKGAHARFGVERVPAAVAVREGRVFRRVEGAHDAEAWARALLPHDVAAPVATAGAPARPMPIVYTTPTCVWCGRLKGWLQQQGVAYREVDIAADPAAADALVARSGQMGVPQVEIGNQFVIGFDRDRLSTLLGRPA